MLLAGLILRHQPINAIYNRIPETESPEEPVVRVSSAVAECPVVAAAVVADASAVGRLRMCMGVWMRMRMWVGAGVRVGM
jgi:hypothetical protein